MVGTATLSLTIAACSTGRHSPRPDLRPFATQEGIASWYGPGFHGRPTANGEIYDQHALTAAHPSLPLGSWVLVTNLDNGRTVTVRVNDRGPFVEDRIIDLSYAAARRLDMVRPGIGRVHLTVLDDLPISPRVPAPATETPRAAPDSPVTTVDATAPPEGRFMIQVASFTDAARAEHLRRVVAQHFPEAHVVPVATTSGRSHRVRLGPYPQRRVALARADLVHRLGYPAVVVDLDRP